MLRSNFPLAESNHGAEEIFGNIVGVLGSDFNQKIHQEALYLLLTQVRAGDTGLLVDVLLDRSLEETRSVLREMFGCLPDIWFEATYRQIMHLYSWEALVSSPFPDAPLHYALPFVRFLLHIIRRNFWGAMVVFDCGFADLVLCLCLTDHAGADWASPSATYDLFQACLTGLSELVNHPATHEPLKLRFASIQMYWPRKYMDEFQGSYFASVMSSVNAPSSLELEWPFLLRRLNGIMAAMKWQDSTILDFPCIVADLIQYYPECSKDHQDIKYILYACLSELITSHVFRGKGWKEIYEQLMLKPYDVVVGFMFKFIQYILEMSLPVFNSTITREIKRVSVEKSGILIPAFMDFVGFVTERSEIMRTVLVEAGVFSFRIYRDGEYWKRFQYRPSVLRDCRGATVASLEKAGG